MIYLKQSTASQEIPLGYFVDSTDGDTEETGLTIANTDLKLWKNGATTLADKNSGGATHISNGIYYTTLDATDTNTLGPLVIFCHVAGALAVKVECCVLAANIYDSWIAGTDTQDVTVTTNSDKTGYSIDTNNDKTGYTVSTVSDKTGYSLAADQSGVTIGTVTTNTDMRGTDNAATAANLATLDGKVDTVDTNVDSILVDTGTTLPASIAALNDITVADIIAGVADGTYDLQEMMRIIFAFAAGKSTGGGTTTHSFRDSADGKNRITATVDANGNRTAVTLDAS
jgi:hypothetical protein